MSFFAWEWKIILIPVPCFETAAWDINSNIWLAGIFIKYWIDSRLFWWFTHTPNQPAVDWWFPDFVVKT